MNRQNKNNNLDFPTIIKNKLINEKLSDITMKEMKNALKEMKSDKATKINRRQ